MAYLSPGVYVEEVPSAAKPIAGVGTSTAGFIGGFDNKITAEAVGSGDGTRKNFRLKNYPAVADDGTYSIKGAGTPALGKLTTDPANKTATVMIDTAPSANAAVTVDYLLNKSAAE